jgi:glucose-6-phosphate 1-dehydrogenase
MEENPFQSDNQSRNRPAPCSVVIFGATGDLTNRKLIPVLYHIAADGSLPPKFKVLGFARRDKDDALFRSELQSRNENYSRQGHDETLWENFSHAIHYHQSEFNDFDGYLRLKERLDELDAERGTPANRLFYLASAPPSSTTFSSNSKNLVSTNPPPTAAGRGLSARSPSAQTSPPRNTSTR